MLRHTLQDLKDWTTLRFRRVGRTIPLADVIAGAQQGNPHCLGELYGRYRVVVVGFLGSLTPADAEDIAQEVFLRLTSALDGYEDRGNFEGWLKRVAYNVYRTHRRSVERRREDDLGEGAVGPATDLGQVTRDDMWTHALAGMPAGLREVWVLHREGYEAKDIAEIMGISAAAAATRLTRARDFLKGRLPGLI